MLASIKSVSHTAQPSHELAPCVIREMRRVSVDDIPEIHKDDRVEVMLMGAWTR